MKKLSGWIIIIFSTIILSSFLLTLAVLLPGMISNTSEVGMTTKEITSSSIGFLFFIGCSIAGIIYGIKKIRSPKNNTLESYDHELDIELSGKIEYKNYRNLILNLTFTKPFYFIRIGLIILVSLTIWNNQENLFESLDSSLFGVLILIGLLLSPVFTVRRINKAYQSNKLFSESLHYHLTNYALSIKGDTIDSTLKWERFIKVKETKNFYLFYQDNVIATLIEKEMFQEQQLNEFQRFVNSLNFKTT